MTCKRSWNPQETLAYVANELKIPAELQDQYDPCTVTLNLIKGNLFQVIESFQELEDSMRVLIDCQVKTFKEQIKDKDNELIPVVPFKTTRQ